MSSFSFTNGNGFTGTVTNPSTTPSLSLSPSFTGWAYSNGTTLEAATLTGDCSFTLEAITCTKTNGVAFVASATTDTTNASNISSGTLSAARLPAALSVSTSINGTTIAASAGTAGGSTGSFTLNDCVKVGSTNPLEYADAGAGCGTGSGPTLQTNGTNNPTQTTLNLESGQGIVVSNPSGGNVTFATNAPERTVTTSPTVLSTDMGGQIISNVSGGGTLTIPAISSTVFAQGMTLSVVNYSGSTEAVAATPTVNSGGGCVTATGIPGGSTWQLLSNGTTIDCFQTSGSGGSGSGTVNTGITSHLTYYASSTNAVSSAGNATISAGALSLGSSGTLGSVTLGNATSGTVTLQPVTGALGSVTASLPANTGTLAELNLAQTFSAAQTFSSTVTHSVAGAASAPAETLSGAPYTGGTGTTTFPLFYLNSGATAPTTFSTNGTFLGINAPSGFTGRLADFYINGTEVAKLSTYGNLTSIPVAAATATSVTPNCEYGFVKVTTSATGTFTINAPTTCTPVDGQRLELKIINTGGATAYSWNGAYIASATLALPTAPNASSKEDYFIFQWDADKDDWAFLAYNAGF